MFRRRGAGLIGAAATTAVVAGTAGAVRHRQQQRYAGQAADQQAAIDQAAQEQVAAQQAAAQAAAPPPAAPAAAAPDKAAQLEKLAGLKEQGVLTEEEFAAEKAKILAS